MANDLTMAKVRALIRSALASSHSAAHQILVLADEIDALAHEIQALDDEIEALGGKHEALTAGTPTFRAILELGRYRDALRMLAPIFAAQVPA